MLKRKVAIAGAGLSGLFAAAALARRGVEVVVCEKAAKLGEAGAGIQISPNGARMLQRIDALAEVEAAAFQPEAAEIRLGSSGATVLHLPLGASAEARWGGPYLQIHRADLMAALENAARRAGAEIRLGKAVAGAANAGDRAVLVLDGGETVEADAVLGADGLHSTVRAALFGTDPARFTGQIAWRGTVETARLPPGLLDPTATVWVGPGRHIVLYYLRRGTIVNFVAVEERAAWTEESWWQRGELADLRRAFSGWHPAVTSVLDAADSCLLWGLFDRAPLRSWVDGRVALLGDACHAMLPFMAQGAVQGFEDGAALARHIGSGVAVTEALAAYEADRRARATRVQLASRANARLFHASGVLDRLVRYAPMAIASRLAPKVAMGQFDWLYGYTEPA